MSDNNYKMREIAKKYALGTTLTLQYIGYTSDKVWKN